MALLSDIKARIDAYLLIKGDKEVLSVSTCQGGTDEFILNMADVWNGPIGTNPYAGRDTLRIPKRSANASCSMNAPGPVNAGRAQNAANHAGVQGAPAQARTGCPAPLPANYDSIRGMVKDRMYGLMPGWFEQLDETFDPVGPDPDISAITSIYMQDMSKDLDGIIHEYFKDGWFKYHNDGEHW